MSPKRAAGGLALLAVVAFGFVLNTAVRMPCYDVCGSDIGRLYEDRGIDRAHPPYFSRDLEYPPLIGEVMYAGTVPVDSGLRGRFLVNMAVLTGLALVTTWMLWRRYGRRTWRWALSPPLLLQGLQNWDLLSVAPATIGLLRWEDGAPFVAGVLLGVGAAAKLYPALFVPILAAAALGTGQPRRSVRVIAGAALGLLVVVVPVYALKPDALRYFATFHGDRGPDRGALWYFVVRTPMMHTWLGDQTVVHLVTIGGSVLLGAGLLACVAAAWRRSVGAVAACALVTIVCLLTSKIYSPQYDLWVVPFLVMLPVRKNLVVHFYVASTLVFLLTASDDHVLHRPVSGQILGLAVVYRFVVLVLIGIDVIRTRSDAPASRILRLRREDASHESPATARP